MIIFTYQSLSEIVQNEQHLQDPNRKHSRNHMLNCLLELNLKTIQQCYTSIDSQDQLFLGLIELLIQLMKEQSGLEDDQKQKVECIYQEINNKVH